MADAMTDLYIEWIRDGLKQPGKTQIGLAAHLGIAHPQITQLLKGRRKLKVHELPKIAQYLELTLPNSDVKPTGGDLVPAYLTGFVEAGAFREVDDFDQTEPEMIMVARDERYPHARVLLFEVSGDSMNDLRPRPILPGDRVRCVAFEDIARNVVPRDGMVVIVQRTRDGGHYREWSVKQIEIYEDRTEFHPRSTNPRHKPIIVPRDFHSDDGTVVEIIGLLREVTNRMPDY